VVSEEYTVRLERVFQGPMDLLLHLVREQEVEIHEIEIARIIDGYLGYMQVLEELDIELAGEFTVMAATLMSIKSRSLLPQEEVDLEEELDPRDELIERLIEYRRFKAAADDLGERRDGRNRLFGRGRFVEADDEDPEVSLDLGELTPWDLLAAFSRLMRETLADRTHHVVSDPRPLRFYVARLADEMRSHGRSTLRKILRAVGGHETKETLVGSFCALLELVRMGVVTAVQRIDDDDIEIEFTGQHEVDLQNLIRAASFDDEHEALGELAQPPPDPAQP
jgi:segregation and condensation protein A